METEMTTKTLIKCVRCGGTIMQNYDEIKCFQCDREYDEHGNLIPLKWGNPDIKLTRGAFFIFKRRRR